MEKTFDIILSGVGGQGIITLLMILDQAALFEGYDVKSSELHGLSQRGGSVQAHVRFGKKVNSPLVQNGAADLIFGLELTEGLRSSSFASAKTNFLINKYILSFLGGMPEAEILCMLPKDRLYLVPASEICKEKLQKEVVSSIYLLGYAIKNDLLPLKKDSVEKAIEKVIPIKYKELNIKAFELGYAS